MSPQVWLILASANLAAVTAACSFLAYAIAMHRWHRRGIFLVLLALVMSGQVWLIPQAINLFGFGNGVPLYQLWFADWLVSGFSAVLLWLSLKDSTRDLADAARLDGCGALGIYWHVVLPLVRRALALIALFTSMATLNQLVSPLIYLAGRRHDAFSLQLNAVGLPVMQRGLGMIIAGSLLMTLPVIVSFFFAQRSFPVGESRAAIEESNHEARHVEISS